MQNKTLLIVLFLAAVVVIFFTATADRRTDTENSFDSQAQLPNSGSNADQSQPELPPIRDIDFYRQLSPGTQLQLQLDNQGVLALIDIAINEASSVDGVTTVRGTVGSQGSYLMTVGDQFLHIFLSYAGGIYEYSGRDFQGTVKRTTDMRFENDIARLPNRSQPVDTVPVRRSAEAVYRDPEGETEE